MPRSFFEFQREFNNEKIYTKRDVAEMRSQWEREYVINRVVQKGKDCDIALQILAVHRTPEGTLVIVR